MSKQTLASTFSLTPQFLPVKTLLAGLNFSSPGARLPFSQLLFHTQHNYLVAWPFHLLSIEIPLSLSPFPPVSSQDSVSCTLWILTDGPASGHALPHHNYNKFSSQPYLGPVMFLSCLFPFSFKKGLGILCPQEFIIFSVSLAFVQRISSFNVLPK